MNKIVSLFKRNYDTHLVYDEVVPGAEWVINGEGQATIKYDGTCCLVRNGKLYKRYDRKLIKSKYKLLKNDKSYIPQIEDYKPAPKGWEAAEEKPNHFTGHWPGWIPVGDGPEDKWHRDGWENSTLLENGTYELVGPKISTHPDSVNFYHLETHQLWKHGLVHLDQDKNIVLDKIPRTFNEIKQWFEVNEIEGIVWHHKDGRMVKIKRSDFGLPWPV